MIAPKITNLGYSNLWTDMSTILGYASNFDQQILKLFANGEQGFFYDPNDLSTMFQDAAGTVPVTAQGQPVGFILDKSGRNNHAYQTTSASRPILRKNAVTGANYLEFDGTDDFLQTSNIDFTATDKVSLFAGVRKLSDAGTGIVCELSAASNIGSFTLYAPYDTNNKGYAGRLRGLSDARTLLTKEPTAPSSSVVSFLGTLGNSHTTKLRINSMVVSDMTGIVSQGFLSSDALYIGRRAGTTHPFNGHIYSLIGIGRLTTDNEIMAIEKALAKNTGVTLNV